MANIRILIDQDCNDNLSVCDNVLRSFSEESKKLGFEIIDNVDLEEIKNIQRINDYDQEEKLNEAVKKYYDLELSSSIKILDELISSVCKVPMSKNSAKICFKSLVMSALIDNVNKDFISSKNKIKRAVEIIPNARLSDYYYPFSFVKYFSDIKNKHSKYYKNSKIRYDRDDSKIMNDLNIKFLLSCDEDNKKIKMEKFSKNNNSNIFVKNLSGVNKGFIKEILYKIKNSDDLEGYFARK